MVRKGFYLFYCKDMIIDYLIKEKPQVRVLSKNTVQQRNLFSISE